MRNLRKERIGLVKSSKMDKSIVVTVERKEKHPKYGKFLKKSTSFVAHDEKNECNEGDTVNVPPLTPYQWMCNVPNSSITEVANQNSDNDTYKI